MTNLARLSLLLVLGCLAIPGCSGAPAKDTAYPVSGKVTVGGQPLSGYQISFVPVEGDANSAENGSSTTTGSDGSYTLQTLDGRSGCAKGKYKVMIKPGPQAMQEAMKSMKGNYNQKGAPPVTSKVPPSYGDPQTSPKEVEVKAESNTINIDI